jgi:branched-subunit amino acid ABC-type transport system permease component
LITAIGASFFLQYFFRGLYGSGVEAYPQVKILTGDMSLANFMLVIGAVIVIAASWWGIRALYRYLNSIFITRHNLSWLPAILSGLILLLLIYLVAPLIQSLLILGLNSLSSEGRAIAEISTPISRIQFVVVLASVLLMAGLYYFIQNTKIGKAMRAVAEDKDVAALMGIDVDRVITITFALGAAMAGAGGVLYGLMFRQVNFFMGFFPGLKAFTAAVLGGIGNVPGAMLGGFFLGIFESLGPSLFLEGLGIPAPFQLKDAIAFTMLVLVLIFRPAGIMGVDIGKKKA